MNDKLIKMFKDLSSYEESIGRHFPARAYTKAVAVLKNFPEEIVSIEQVKSLPGFGKGLIEKVESFLQTGTFNKYEEFKNSEFAKLTEISNISFKCFMFIPIFLPFLFDFLMVKFHIHSFFLIKNAPRII